MQNLLSKEHNVNRHAVNIPSYFQTDKILQNVWLV